MWATRPGVWFDTGSLASAPPAAGVPPASAPSTAGVLPAAGDSSVVSFTVSFDASSSASSIVSLDSSSVDSSVFSSTPRPAGGASTPLPAGGASTPCPVGDAAFARAAGTPSCDSSDSTVVRSPSRPSGAAPVAPVFRLMVSSIFRTRPDKDRYVPTRKRISRMLITINSSMVVHTTPSEGAVSSYSSGLEILATAYSHLCHIRYSVTSRRFRADLAPAPRSSAAAPRQFPAVPLQIFHWPVADPSPASRDSCANPSPASRDSRASPSPAPRRPPRRPPRQPRAIPVASPSPAPRDSRAGIVDTVHTAVYIPFACRYTP